MKIEHQVKQLEARVNGLEQAVLSFGLISLLILTISIFAVVANFSYLPN